MRALRPLQSTALLACLLLSLAATPAQEGKQPKGNAAESGETATADGTKESEGKAAPRRSARGRQWSLSLERQIPLPGPLPEGTPRLTEAGVELLVAGGVALVDWKSGRRLGEPANEPTDNSAESSTWATSPNGKYRFKAQESGWILAQKRCKRCRTPPWRRKWRLRVSGTTPVAPVATDQRVFFGAMDNRVYSLRARNGHRVWVTDIKGRPLRGLVLARWQPPPPLGSEEFDPPEPPGEPLELVLAIPGDGARLVALSAETGAKVADFSVDPAEGRLVGRPVMTEDGAILVGRNDYDEEQAALVVLRLDQVAGAPGGQKDDVEYNGPPPPQPSPEKGKGTEGAADPAPDSGAYP